MNTDKTTLDNSKLKLEDLLNETFDYDNICTYDNRNSDNYSDYVSDRSGIISNNFENTTRN